MNSPRGLFHKCPRNHHRAVKAYLKSAVHPHGVGASCSWAAHFAAWNHSANPHPPARFSNLSPMATTRQPMSLPADNSEQSSSTDEDTSTLAPPLPPPTFSTRSLLLAITFIAIVLAAWRAVGPAPTILFLLLAISVAAHVAANAIGTTLRNRADEQDSPRDGWIGQASQAGDSLETRRTSHQPPPRVETTNLSQRQRLGWPSRLSILIGAALGGVGGAVLLLSTDTDKATWPDTLLGSLAFAALGGMAGFVMGSFLQVVYRALRQANGGSQSIKSR